jgi:hypothetical protein
MRTSIFYGALAFAVAAGTSAANAQTTITRQISDQPVETIITQQPVVRTTETVRTVRPAARSTVRHQVVMTRRTIVSQQVVPTRTVAPQAIDDTVATNPQPLYDVVPPAPIVDGTMIGQPAVGSTIPIYRYIYEPDRILVIDPNTNIAIQALPR